MISALVPSRGLLHSRTVEALDRELSGVEHNPILYTHNEPIPDCFNSLSERFMDTDSDLAWFVEEDVVPPRGALKALLELLGPDVDVSFVNYPLIKFKNAACYKFFQGDLIWTGLGCTLVKRKIFEALPRPWFLDKHSLVAICTGSAQKEWKLELRENKDVVYGGQDIYFFGRAYLQGFRIGVVPHMECKHLNEADYKDRYEEQVSQ